jgi:hypothetical protein
MSTNRDASNTTMRRGQLALYTWRQSYNYPARTTTVYPEQATNSMNQGPSASVPLNAYVGAQLVGQALAGCGCSTAVTLQGYDVKAPASC